MRRSLAAILRGGLVAGTVDIAAAAMINRLSPVVILRAIASGALGKAAFRPDAWIACLGLLLQWGMSLLIAAIFVAAASRLGWMRRRWIAAGLASGVVVYGVMNYLVVPLSAAPFKAPATAYAVAANLLAMLVFGLIVAFFARQHGTGTR